MQILLAEDDRDLSRALCALLTHAGYRADAVENGEEALDCARSGHYDAMIFDWMMPVMDGVTALRTLRAEGNATPCLILTARESVADRIEGLDAGADDYLAKPFAMSELLARLRAMLRRGDSWHPDRLTVGDLMLDRAAMTLNCKGASLRLTSKAFMTMQLLMDHPGIVFSAERIMDRVWGWSANAEINVVWVNISQLRKKLVELDSGMTITAIRGSGYVLEEKKP